jgi:hypothetical protein
MRLLLILAAAAMLLPATALAAPAAAAPLADCIQCCPLLPDPLPVGIPDPIAVVNALVCKLLR